MQQAAQNIKVQKIVLLVAAILFIIKVLAWYSTRSVAIMTDALESTINIITGIIGLYTIYLSSRPKDSNHPYGHGKAEFVSSAIEGTLIFVAGIIIIYESLYRYKFPKEVNNLDYGIILIAITALVNGVVGYYTQYTGKKNNSLALLASGKHLLSDTYSTLGIVLGLLIQYITGVKWIDGFIAIIFAVVIMFTGYRIIRQSLAGIMDEADMNLLGILVKKLNEKRLPTWIDIHNTRIIKYGSILHVDCHLTVPWYFNVYEAHREIELLEVMVQSEFGDRVELFVHTDGCMDFSCKLCKVENCQERKFNFSETITWTIENISTNTKHQIN